MATLLVEAKDFFLTINDLQAEQQVDVITLYFKTITL